VKVLSSNTVVLNDHLYTIDFEDNFKRTEIPTNNLATIGTYGFRQVDSAISYRGFGNKNIYTSIPFDDKNIYVSGALPTPTPKYLSDSLIFARRMKNAGKLRQVTTSGNIEIYVGDQGGLLAYDKKSNTLAPTPVIRKDESNQIYFYEGTYELKTTKLTDELPNNLLNQISGVVNTDELLLARVVGKKGYSIDAEQYKMNLTAPSGFICARQSDGTLKMVGALSPITSYYGPWENPSDDGQIAQSRLIVIDPNDETKVAGCDFIYISDKRHAPLPQAENIKYIRPFTHDPIHEPLIKSTQNFLNKATESNFYSDYTSGKISCSAKAFYQYNGVLFNAHNGEKECEIDSNIYDISYKVTLQEPGIDIYIVQDPKTDKFGAFLTNGWNILPTKYEKLGTLLRKAEEYIISNLAAIKKELERAKEVNSGEMISAYEEEMARFDEEEILGREI